MIIENRNLLKKKYSQIYEKLEMKYDKYNDRIGIEKTPNGDTIFFVENSHKYYLHSKYNPVEEAEIIFEQYGQLDLYDFIIFYGTGLGYHIDYFTKNYPEKEFAIFEPIPGILYRYLDNKELSFKNLKNIGTGSTEKDIKEMIRNILTQTRKKILFIELPCYKEIISDEYNRFFSLFKKNIKNTRSSIYTNMAFQKRWIINSMINFDDILTSPNILIGNKDKFEGKTAILAGAGPSLNDEIENLRKIKENGLAYIFSLGSAVNSLVHHGIYPDGALTYDPSEKNQMVFEKLVKEDIDSIPLVYGSSVGYETLQNYPGPTLHVLTSQDTVSKYFLKAKKEAKIQGVVDSPSITGIAIQLLYLMKFKQIILVGQNLAFRGAKDYASGIDYYANGKSKRVGLNNKITTRDVYGNEVRTTESFNRMRRQMESIISKLQNEIEVFNTTKGGAQIEGTIFIPLERIMKTGLQEKVVNDNWYQFSLKPYDDKALIERARHMKTEYIKAKNLFEEIEDILSKIYKLARNKNFKQLETMYNKLDDTFKNITENKYFNLFLLPMNRVFFQLLKNETRDIREEKNKIKKAEDIINAFNKFMFECKKDFNDIEEYYDNINKSIEGYTD